MSVAIPVVDLGEIERRVAEKRLQGSGIKTSLGEFLKGNPFHPDLVVVGFRSGLKLIGIQDGAFENMLQLVKEFMPWGESVMATDILANVEEMFDLHPRANLLQTFPPNRFNERLSVSLAAAGENEIETFGVFHFRKEEAIVMENDRSRRGAYRFRRRHAGIQEFPLSFSRQSLASGLAFGESLFLF